MTNKITLAVLVTILVSFTVWCLAHPDAQVEHNADQARRIEALANLNKIEVHCPSFFDAPLGNKPCPAQEELNHVKELVQQSIDAN